MTSLVQGDNGEVGGSVQGVNGGLQGLVVARPRNSLLCQHGKQGRRGGSLFQDMEKGQASENHHGGSLGVHLGVVTGNSIGQSIAFLLDIPLSWTEYKNN